ncbi:hypothetical protein ACGFYM_17655 [Streptomyces sp. NPDC048231]|uniref:hypothetical protein n=1 Tax=Streptomyces sp. NPDC048231 TaxID=3365519 RepID=UPI003711CBA0
MIDVELAQLPPQLPHAPPSGVVQLLVASIAAAGLAARATSAAAAATTPTAEKLRNLIFMLLLKGVDGALRIPCRQKVINIRDGT